MSLKLHEVPILGKLSLARGHLFVVKALTLQESKQKRNCATKCERKMVDTCSYISGELLNLVHFALCFCMESF